MLSSTASISSSERILKSNDDSNDDNIDPASLRKRFKALSTKHKAGYLVGLISAFRAFTALVFAILKLFGIKVRSFKNIFKSLVGLEITDEEEKPGIFGLIFST